jgi:hypothetical protein
MNKLILLPLAVAIVSCTTPEITKPNLVINQDIYNEQKPQKVQTTDMFVRITNIKDKLLSKKVTINQQNISLIDAINIVMPSINVIAEDSDVELNKQVSVRADSIDFGSYLKQLANISKYHITTDGDKVFISSKLTKSWDLSTFINKESVITTNGEGLQSAAVNNNLDEVVRQLKSMLGDDAFVNYNKDFGLLNVSSAVDKINLADNYLTKLIDNSKKQIFFDVQIVETNIDDNLNAGIDFSIFSKGATSGIGGSSGVISISSMLKKPIVFDELNLDLMLNLLNQYGKTQVINNPSILLQNGVKKTLTTGEQSSYVKSIESTVQDTSVIVTPVIESLSTGLELEIGGIVSANNKIITIDVHPKLSSIKSWEKLTTGSGDYTQEYNLPSFNETDLSVKVMVKPGQTLLIGGLYAESYAADENSADNKLLDAVFGSNKTNKTKKQILVLIKPTLMQL